MQDRGTLIAGAGIGLACLIAGAFYLVTVQREGDMRAREEIRHAVDVQQAHADAMHRLEKEQAARTPKDAVAAGTEWLVQQQSPDGAWRSDIHAPFKNGTALTPLALVALQQTFDPQAFPPGGRDPILAGCEWLAKLVKPDGSIEGAEGEIDFPVYTASLAVIALSHPDQKPLAAARDVWLKFLLSHQLTEQNGWKPGEKQYGGWGYCRLIPKRPAPGTFSPPLVESNLSATVFALEALKAAGVKDKEAYSKALTFVRSRQNYRAPDSPVMLPPEYEDGGFTFIYDDPVRNKAGAIEPRATNRDAFNSYGSATADGLRALRLAGETDAMRVEAAERWLATHFRADRHPGKYIPSHESNRDSVYFYYAASVSQAWSKRGAEWVPKLAAELVKRQQHDGSWANTLNMVREDDPLVATSNALIALANCTRDPR